MHRRTLAWLALLAAIPVSLQGQGGIPVGPAPGGEHCVLRDTDTCAVGPYAPIVGYGWGWEGAFIGDLELDLDAPGYHHAAICTGVVLAGVLVTGLDDPPFGLLFPDCHHEGRDPPQDLPVTLTCTSRGTGLAACSVID